MRQKWRVLEIVVLTLLGPRSEHHERSDIPGSIESSAGKLCRYALIILNGGSNIAS
jgi:hypothetical protein